MAGPARALVVANRLPWPLDDGWKRRTFHVVQAVSALRPVTLVSLHAGGGEEADRLRDALDGAVDVVTVPRPPRLTAPAALLLGLATGTPWHVWRVRSRALRHAIDRVLDRDRFDLGIATLFHLHPYLRALPAGALRVVDTHNIDSLVLRRYAQEMWGPLRGAYARATANRLARHEAEVCGAADVVWVCSETERAQLAGPAGGARIEVIPNGVDAFGQFADPGVATEPHRIVFFGKLDYHPNADAVSWFARDILPAIRRRRPEAELWVAGAGATADHRALAAQDPGMKLLGRVTDLAPVVGGAGVVVVPLRAGGGTRLKILEALALGRAVVSTTVGAEGLDLEPGRDLILADEPAAFAGAVADLIGDPARASALGVAGRETVRVRYDWSRIAERIGASLGLTGEPVRPAAAAR